MLNEPEGLKFLDYRPYTLEVYRPLGKARVESARQVYDLVYSTGFGLAENPELSALAERCRIHGLLIGEVIGKRRS